MDQSSQSSGDSTTTTTTNNSNNSSRGNCLKHLNKLSHKISKPTLKKPAFDPNPTPSLDHDPPPPPPQQQQPPVYNINKNDFREVVQKLTGSPAHERLSSPPPVQPPRPPSSRLQRIRPPPLAHLAHRAPPPPSILNTVLNPIPAAARATTGAANPSGDISGSGGFGLIGRSASPLSPLPPFPGVNLAAESPVSAYMRCLQNSTASIDSKPDEFSGFSPLAPLVSPRWNNLAPPAQPPPSVPTAQQVILPPASSTAGMMAPQPPFQLPSSPLPFGCLNSPRSLYPMLSPGLLFSPPSGQLGFPQLPLSPTVPVPSPRYRGI